MRVRTGNEGFFDSHGEFLRITVQILVGLFLVGACKTPSSVESEESKAPSGESIRCDVVAFAAKPPRLYMKILTQIVSGIDEENLMAAMKEGLSMPPERIAFRRDDADAVTVFHPHKEMTSKTIRLPRKTKEAMAVFYKQWLAEESAASASDMKRLTVLALLFHWLDEDLSTLKLVSQKLLDRGEFSLAAYLIEGIVQSYTKRPSHSAFSDPLLASWLAASKSLDRQTFETLKQWFLKGDSDVPLGGKSMDKRSFLRRYATAEHDPCMAISYQADFSDRIFEMTTASDGFLVKVRLNSQTNSQMKLTNGLKVLYEFRMDHDLGYWPVAGPDFYFTDKATPQVLYGDVSEVGRAQPVAAIDCPGSCAWAGKVSPTSYDRGAIYLDNGLGKEVLELKKGKVTATYPGRFMDLFAASNTLIVKVGYFQEESFEKPIWKVEALLLGDGKVAQRMAVDSHLRAPFVETSSQVIVAIREGEPVIVEAKELSGASHRWEYPLSPNKWEPSLACHSKRAGIFLVSQDRSLPAHDGYAVTWLLPGEEPKIFPIDLYGGLYFDGQLSCFDNGAGLTLSSERVVSAQFLLKEDGLSVVNFALTDQTSSSGVHDIGGGFHVFSTEAGVHGTYRGRPVAHFHLDERLKAVKTMAYNPLYFAMVGWRSKKIYLFDRKWLERRAGLL